jgi:olefin beta-lactone synthetase
MLSTDKNIVSAFFRNDPEAIAIVTSGKSFSYGELFSLVRRNADHLRRKNIRLGDRVLILSKPSVELYVHLLALFQLGAVPVFVDAWSDTKRILQSAQTADCKAMAGGWKIRFLSFLLKELRRIPVRLSPDVYSPNEYFKIVEVEEIDPALITFTTGSTGIPKAAIRTHGILAAQLTALSDKIQCEPGKCVYTNLPIVLLISLAKGVSSFLPDLSKNENDLPALLEKNNVMSLVVSPSLALSIAEDGSEKFRNSVTHLVTGGASVFPGDAEKLLKGFPNAKSTVVYGSTEAEPVSETSLKEIIEHKQVISEKGLFVGKIDPVADVVILDRNGKALPVGSAGEIAVSGPHVVTHYFRNDSAMKETKLLLNEKIYHLTGDAGSMDENGNLYLLGRIKYAFNYNGKSYYLIPLEEEIKNIPGCGTGTLIKSGESLHVFVEGGNAESINEWLNKKGFTAEIHMGQRLPRDQRHQSRIDYAQLIP